MVHIEVNYPLFFQICDILGTLAFAISGLRLAASKDFDWFGAYVVGLTTAIGGGTEDECLCGNLNTSLDDDVNEVKRGVRYIVGYQAACIIPQADIKITQ